MKQNLLFFLAAIWMLAACQPARKSVTIQGSVQFTEPGYTVSLTSYHDHVVDTVKVVPVGGDKRYSMTLEGVKPGVYDLNCSYWQTVSVWVEDEDMTVDFRGKDTAKIVIKNPPFVLIKDSPKNEIMNELNFNEYRNYQNMIAIAQASYRSSFASEADKNRLTGCLYDANNADMDARNRYLLDKYASWTSVLAVIGRLNPIEDEDLIAHAFKQLEEAHPGYAPSAELKERLAQEKERKLRMMPGQVAPDFACAGLDGKEIGPAAFRGKILLMDFWASWCGPCRGEVPNLKKAYAQFKGKGVEFLSVSIDAKPEDWKKALEEEGMAWPQVLAPEAGAKIMDLYQFSGIPFILLLDTEGKIVAKNLRGEAIGKAIDDLLNGIRPGDEEKAVPMAAGGMMTPATPVEK